MTFSRNGRVQNFWRESLLIYRSINKTVPFLIQYYLSREIYNLPILLSVCGLLSWVSSIIPSLCSRCLVHIILGDSYKNLHSSYIRILLEMVLIDVEDHNPTYIFILRTSGDTLNCACYVLFNMLKGLFLVCEYYQIFPASETRD